MYVFFFLLVINIYSEELGLIFVIEFFCILGESFKYNRLLEYDYL